MSHCEGAFPYLRRKRRGQLAYGLSANRALLFGCNGCRLLIEIDRHALRRFESGLHEGDWAASVVQGARHVPAAVVPARQARDPVASNTLTSGRETVTLVSVWVTRRW